MIRVNLKKTLKSIKLHETTFSMVLGAIVIVLIGVLLINFFSGRRGETIPAIDVEEEITLPASHTVSEGEDLWTIAEKYYGTGYNWIDIQSENKIINPNQISVGQELVIPDVAPRIAEEIPTETEPEPTLAKTEAQERTHTVQKGENLWKIAELYFDSGYNWVDIAEENDLRNPGVIEPNQELTIPSVTSKASTVVANKKEESEAISGATYTVQKDDNLWDIAIRAYGDGYRWSEIAKENKLINPNLIHNGNILTLPR